MAKEQNKHSSKHLLYLEIATNAFVTVLDQALPFIELWETLRSQNQVQDASQLKPPDRDFGVEIGSDGPSLRTKAGAES